MNSVNIGPLFHHLQTGKTQFAGLKKCYRPISILALFLLWFGSFTAYAQRPEIILGPDEVGENQVWTIRVKITNGQLTSYSAFPDIEGLRKRGTSSQQEMSNVNGQVTSSQSIVMSYVPTGQGTVTVHPFSMKINDQNIQSAGKKVKVGAAVQAQSNDPFRSLFDRDPSRDFFTRGEPEYIDVKDDALLALTTSKNEVYVGEGFTATLAFLVADNNRAPMQFYDIGKQLSEILKKVKPSNCWEENFNIENIEMEPVTINGKNYSQYRIYQATFYPLNTDPVVFPSVGLKMIKFKVAKNPSFFGQNRQEDFKTFYSKEKVVKVRELPPHPLQSSVAVGQYRLDERISTTTAKTGQSVSYEFNVSGEGNISSVSKPVIINDKNFDIYEPNIQQNINRENDHVTGTKSFKYFIVPREPGDFQLGDYFNWVYFDPVRKQYDTLRSTTLVQVTGESQKNQSIANTDVGSFYTRVDLADNELKTVSSFDWSGIFLNLCAGALVVCAMVLAFRKTA